jgi:antitoxin (DNA-binding transcriptional repressor) of toxin-antitoxin stability system
MKRYTVSQARERLADVLDEAERGVSVVIERRDVQYVIHAKPVTRRPRDRRSLIETIDPAVAAGQWHWTWADGGARFTKPRRRK